jgi:L-threonylcarbamoyladenylate synthase
LSTRPNIDCKVILVGVPVVTLIFWYGIQMKTIRVGNQLSQDCVSEACTVLRGGGLVIFPTETMYAAGVDATLPHAVDKLLSFKNRPVGKAISLLVSDVAMAASMVDLSPEMKKQYAQLLPGPYTLISPSLHVCDQRLESEQQTLGIRISTHPFCNQLLTQYGSPVTATSANASGKARPYAITTMLSGLNSKQLDTIDLVIDMGELPHREPSTVIDLSTPSPTLIRLGSGEHAPTQDYIVRSVDQTKDCAKRIWFSIAHMMQHRPLLIFLEGPMGVGKTHLAQGLAKAMGVHEPVTSPTYVYTKEYSGIHRGRTFILQHSDFWRLGFTEFDASLLGNPMPNTVHIIEWGSKVWETLPREQFAVVLITLSETSGGRKIVVRLP